MIQKKTVFVVGAGSNYHAGFPLAQELKRKLIYFANHINVDNEIPGNMPYAVELSFIDGKHLFDAGELKLIKSAATRLKRSSAATLDDFLQRQNEATNKAVKKFIAVTIIKAEEESLKKQYHPDNDWLSLLLRRYTNKEDASSDPFSVFNENVIIVTFNYDLYLEHRILETLNSDFEFSGKQQAKNFISKIKIIHPHGQLGLLKNWGDESEQTIRSYGDFKFLKDNLDLIINSFIGSPLNPEATMTDESYNKARLAIDSAERVIFLGFGYHHTVMSKLFPNWEELQDYDQNNKYYGSYFESQSPKKVYEFIEGNPVYKSGDHVDYASFVNRWLE